MSEWDADRLFSPRKLIRLSDLKLDQRDLLRTIADPPPLSPRMRETVGLWNASDPPALFSSDASDALLSPMAASALFEKIANQPQRVELLEKASQFLTSLSQREGHTSRKSEEIGHGQNGIAVRGVLGKNYDDVFFRPGKAPAFVIKTSLTRQGDRETVNEAAVGLLALNALRAQVPQFMYIYGSYHCSPPRMEYDELRMCAVVGEPSVPYNMVETISFSDTFKGVRTLNRWIRENARSPSFGQDLAEILIQTLLALAVAQQLPGGFSHNDLHAGNVLVREFWSGRKTLRFGDIYQRTRFLVTIIDFGRASAIVPRGLLGSMDRGSALFLGSMDPERGIFPGRTSMLGDVARLVSDCFSVAFRANPETYHQTKLFLIPFLSSPAVVRAFVEEQAGPWIEWGSVVPFDIDVPLMDFVDAYNSLFPSLVGGPDTSTPLF